MHPERSDTTMNRIQVFGSFDVEMKVVFKGVMDQWIWVSSGSRYSIGICNLNIQERTVHLRNPAFRFTKNGLKSPDIN